MFHDLSIVPSVGFCNIIIILYIFKFSNKKIAGDRAPAIKNFCFLEVAAHLSLLILVLLILLLRLILLILLVLVLLILIVLILVLLVLVLLILIVHVFFLPNVRLPFKNFWEVPLLLWQRTENAVPYYSAQIMRGYT